MNMLFYYEQLCNTAAERMKMLADISTNRGTYLLRQLREYTSSSLITTVDVDTLTKKMFTSLGSILCPEAAAEYAGAGKLLEMDLGTDVEK
ncbi:hypothetical protein [Chitinophaga sp. MM2321]|uniref:hypothetical protein n=1 Tax=Chitinophaga sp. MM2321 TaxID=3137178 RepID=UPI0032D574B6